MSAYKNSKSQMTTIRIPHSVIDGMELTKWEGESNAGFIVRAMRGEIARRQSEGLTNPAGEAIRKIASIAATERQRRERRDKCGK
ncbi:YlcI/YnfO family protein [Salmonella enterica]|uniref:YlcI/YnfO family protein n=1 Tax=Salmonella enterica TaxID=28901 RepID=UPI001D335CBC|nr:hypothetical protein [Salmonella enterica subsp. enterica serovar Dahomey]EAW9080418.1 hypothetical protein [Salmonella enterica]